MRWNVLWVYLYYYLVCIRDRERWLIRKDESRTRGGWVIVTRTWRWVT
jgi:hypothetical protein